MTWVNVDHLTSKDADDLQKRFGLHTLDLQDCLSITQTPKIDLYDDYIFLIIHLPTYDTETRRVRTAEINIFVGEEFLVTVHKKTLPALQAIFFNCKDNPDIRRDFFGRQPGFLLYRLLYMFSKDLYPLLDVIKDDLDEVEESMYEGETNVIRELAIVQRAVLKSRRILNPVRSIIGTLVHLNRPFLGEESDVYFDDVHDHFERAWSILENDREIVDALQKTNEALISQRTNEIIKILTIISVSFLPLTLVSSVYGMNIIGLPFAEHAWAFPAIVGGTILFILMILLVFRKRDWI